MKFVGSKNRISKELAPIIQSYINSDTVAYIEPMVGGANMIDKIRHHNRIGFDIHKELIALLSYVKNPNNSLPTEISEEQYKEVRDNKEKYPDWLVGLVGFCATFGAKYFCGYARAEGRNMSSEAIRNIEKQRDNLQGIAFYNQSFLDMKSENVKNCVIYCDIPYKGTTKYATKDFPYDEFYKWCIEMSKKNTVLVSEYYMPEEFECIWSKETLVNFDSNRDGNSNKNRVEKLFIAK